MIEFDGKITTHHQTTAKDFNNYYVSVADNITNNNSVNNTIGVWGHLHVSASPSIHLSRKIHLCPLASHAHFSGSPRAGVIKQATPAR